ncbi:MAG: heavy-metal-associated domain-containing protein [Fimbriimonadales bacterium]|nr:heavy-metal-associated domain-containing protein [Fimbriimonadales bacterium]
MNLQEKVWKTPDIECEGCVRAIHHALDDVDGVQQVEVDLLQKTVRVVFDSACVQAEQLKRWIEEAGFTPSE